MQAIVKAIHAGFREKKQAFDLDKILEPVECTLKDVEVATRQYYQSFVGRHWTNGLPDDKQTQMITWVAARLKLKPQDVESINLRVAETACQRRKQRRTQRANTLSKMQSSKVGQNLGIGESTAAAVQIVRSVTAHSRARVIELQNSRYC